MTLKLAKPTGASLKLAKPTGAKLLMRTAWQPMDANAAAYIAAVETADGQALEEKTKIAIDNFVLGCKADGIWDAIKASCILAGARSLTGALIPLKGAAPANNNFVSADYNRKTGLKGNGATKYLNSNRNNNADPQNSRHLAVYATETESFTGGSVAIGTSNVSGGSTLRTSITVRAGRISSSPDYTSFPFSFRSGLWGASRSSSSTASFRYAQTTTNVTNASATPVDQSINVFYATSVGYSTTRLAFYSIGESLDLALLDARVTDLINAFGAAIP